MIGSQLEPGDEQPARSEVPGDIGEDRALRSRGEQDHHVPGRDHDVELPPEVERHEVCLDPAQLGRPAAGGREHLGIEIHADDVDTAAGELARNATGAAARIERRRRREAHHEGGFAVDVRAGRGQVVVAPVIRVTGEVLRPEPAVVLGHRSMMPRYSSTGRTSTSPPAGQLFAISIAWSRSLASTTA